MSIHIIGIGPGKIDGLTIEAKERLEQSDIIVGYTVYVDLLKEYFPDKEYYTTPMKQEIQRCEWALEQAELGKQIAIVCSGDAGVYGMAGLVYQLREKMPNKDKVEIHVIPGVTAALSGAALLGAPLTHDFAVISLSDLLTPLEKIMGKIKCVALADMVICLYNPSSQKRADYLKQACELIMKFRKPDTVCGYVKNIGRNGEEAVLLSLKELSNTQVDMFTTVFIGNSTTLNLSGNMVTPRGYKDV